MSILSSLYRKILIQLKIIYNKIVNNLLEKEIRPDIFTCGDQVVIDHDLMMNESDDAHRFNDYPNFLQHIKIYHQNFEVL